MTTAREEFCPLELALICLLTSHGYSYHQISLRLRRSRKTVRKWALRLGYPSNRKAPH